MRGKKKTNNQFIEEAKAIHGKKYDYSKVDYTDSRLKVCIICPIHGEFWQIPNNHLHGQGCPKCAKRYMDEDYFKQIATKVHKGKYDYSKVEYKDSRLKVCIICPIHGEFWQSPNSHISHKQGCPRCKAENSKSLVCGVGINDYVDFVKPNQQHLQSYVIWKSMLGRCYVKNRLKKHPTYVGCSVCDEWLYFSKFKEWFDEHYVDGYELDKDILVQGNKVYSPQTCCFVPPQINTLIISKKSKRRKGVTISRGRFTSRYHTTEGVVNLGVFDSEIEAHEAYKKAKKEHIDRVATSFYNEGKITKEVRDALYRWEIKEY